MENGYINAQVLDKGINGWQEAGYVIL